MEQIFSFEKFWKKLPPNIFIYLGTSTDAHNIIDIIQQIADALEKVCN